MSILLHHPKVSPATRRELGWARADDGFWVADDAAAFAGTIDRQNGHFSVRNGFAEYIGDYSTLAAAQAALAAHVERARSERPC
ncbi:hypothetical protein GCM10017714_17390 [Curtobacterium pusillum]|uniref:Uncharacterized protein n=1 Tax=Curtobacterium pusillum TaxID=69373 RepID=A0AAW3T841_9MICO|nr:hypothetical protein [Curtobacterium pusillum]MBA8991228.1 hypothetical protein [Curtobacterium pusillum]NUU14418.1 hypothetical protein [Curtobacterium pusillum]GLK30998.1 hypothetical protein GCM10017610_12830 [Curtobacterium pusillum]